MRVLIMLLAAHTVAAEPKCYGEVAVGGGVLATSEQSPNGFSSAAQRNIIDARFAAGLAFEAAHDTTIHAGAVLDLLFAGSKGAAYGIEATAGRQGYDLRAAVEHGDGNGTVGTGDGLVLMAGGRLHNNFASVGVDIVRVQGTYGHANGVVVDVGIVGRPGTYALATSAGLAAIGALGLIILGSQIHDRT